MSTKSDVADAVSDIEGWGGWVSIDCVVCGRDNKMRVCLAEGEPTYSYYQCWSPSCGVRGFFGEHSAEVSTKKKVVERRFETEALPEEFEPLSTKSGALKQRRLEKFREYLYGRGVSQFLIDEANLGCINSGKLSGYVVIPYYKDGKVLGWVGRSIYQKRYFYPPDWPKTQWPYNGDALLVEDTRPAIVVEGQFDALNLYPFGVGVGGQPTDYDWDLMLKARRPLVLCFDADEGAKSEFGVALLRLEAMRRKSKAKFAWMRIPAGTDPGSLEREKLLRRAMALHRGA